MGNLLDRNLKGIGRIQKAFGTTDPDTINGIKTMVTTLYKGGDWNLLEAVRDGKLTLLQVYSKWKKQDVKSVTTTGVLKFDPTAYDWLDQYNDIKAVTKDNYRENFDQLKKVKADFNLDDLPSVLKDYRKQCQKKGVNRRFNTVRNACRSFLKNYFDQFHPLYQQVVAVKPLEEKRKREERAWSVAEVQTAMKKMKPEVAAQFWTMCVTGAGLKEYENGLKVEGDGIRIKGDKMARVDDRRNRVVPKVVDPAPLVVRVKRARVHLKDANKDMQLYDARRCFSHWCLEAGIPFDRVQQYMGHAPKSMTERYARSTLKQFLKDDAEKLRTYIEKEQKRKVNKAAAKFFDF